MLQIQYHARIKEVGIDMHFVREMIVSKLLEVRYVSMYVQVVDALTKGLSLQCFQKLKDKLKVTDSPFLLRGYRGHVKELSNK